MLNLNQTIEALGQVDAINASTLLNAEDKRALIELIYGQFALTFPGVPTYTILVRDALARHLGIEDNGRQSRTAATPGGEEEDGETSGVQDATEVDAGRPEESPKAAKRKTKGVPAKA